MASGPTMTRPTAATVPRTPIVIALRLTSRRKPERSPAAHDAERPGKAASAIETPISATGTLWKLRAKLMELTDPAASVLATLVKNRKVSGSIGWLTILGTISRTNSRMAGVRTSSRNRSGTDERRIPTTRIPRWSDAPMTAPTAAALMPIASWNSTVPATIPAL
jgi:hypothetical protein